MKKLFSKRDSRLLFFLLILILVLIIRSGKYTYIVNALFFVVLFFYYRPVLTLSTAKYFAVFIFLTIWGIIHGNDTISIIGDLLSFSPLILLFIENKSLRNDLNGRLPSYLANSLLFMIPISALIYTYMGYSFGSIDAGRFMYNKEISMALMGPIIPLLFAPYLVFYSEILSKKQMLLVHSSIIIIGLFGVITLTKSVVLSAFTPYLIYYAHKASKRSLRPILKWIFVLFIVSIGIFQYGIFKGSSLYTSIDGLVVRTNQGIENSNFNNNRLQETTDYLNQNLNLFEYFFGRGMGGKKVRNDSDEYIGGIGMMHFGPSHVFIKGGLLLVLVLYVPLLLAILRFWNTPNYHISLILLLFLIYNIQTTTWNWGTSLFFYWYGVTYPYKSTHRIQLHNNL